MLNFIWNCPSNPHAFIFSHIRRLRQRLSGVALKSEPCSPTVSVASTKPDNNSVPDDGISGNTSEIEMEMEQNSSQEAIEQVYVDEDYYNYEPKKIGRKLNYVAIGKQIPFFYLPQK